MGDTITRLYPTLMPGAVNVKAVAAGGAHSLVLTASGTVLATGRNQYGQLGDGTTIDHTTLAPVKNANLISAIGAGYLHSVILRPFTRALATGRNDVGQLGTGSTVQQNTLTSVSSVTSILAVASGPYGNHSLLLKADGSVWACGYNASGQLGQGTTTNSTIPVKVKGPGGVGYLSNIIAIAAGDNHSLALAADGTIYAWGYNGYGQLGLGDTANRLYPVQLPARNIYAIATGGYHNLLLADNGWIATCGWNAFYQLGLGITNGQSYFVAHEFGPFGLITLASG
jgi:alpha-tubulin suppressor-like RCC1 family protein